MTREKFVPVRSELICIFRESLPRNLGLLVRVCTAVKPVFKTSFTFHRLLPS